MRDVKRIEVVIDAVHVERVTAVLRDAGAGGFTVLRGAWGEGDRGPRRPDGVSGAFETCVVLCACDPGKVEAITAALRPVLKRCGGVGLVSEAQWVDH
ncbi:MAG: transcriptional regulator [Planctomycetota bacterium]